MPTYILAIDQGTTSSRALIIQNDGKIISQAQQEFKQHYPQNGWVEHNPDEIWLTTHQCCVNSIQKAGLTSNEIKAIGITNQRETTIIWDRKTGQPIYNAIVWQDRRTKQMCEELLNQPQAYQINQKTGLLLDPYLSATKIKWILDNVPNARQRANNGELAFGTIDTFLLWKITQGKSHATDVTNASRTLLLNLKTRQWDQSLLDFFDIPASLLPEVKDNCADFGLSDAALFGREIPVTAMIGDQQSALVGQACLKPGMMKSTYGTGCFLLANTGDDIIYSKNNLLSTIAYQINGVPTYGLEGSIFNAGTTVKWLRDNLQLIKQADEAEQLAKSVESTDGVFFVPAFTGLGAPYWDPGARGAIIGLTRDTSIGHIVRAALEAVCYRTLDLVKAMTNDGIGQIHTMRIDGGMSKNNWMAQFLANVTQIEVQRPTQIETTALGAGFLAALGAGIYQRIDDIEQFIHNDKVFSPKIALGESDRLYDEWLKAIHRVRTTR